MVNVEGSIVVSLRTPTNSIPELQYLNVPLMNKSSSIAMVDPWLVCIAPKASLPINERLPSTCSVALAYVSTIAEASDGPMVKVCFPLMAKVSPLEIVGRYDCNKEESSVRTISFPETWLRSLRSITAASETGTPRERERERERENIPPTALATFDFLKYIRTTVPFRQEKHALLITGWRDLVWTART